MAGRPRVMEHVLDWSELSPDMVFKIASCLAVPEDLLAFRGVCKSWRASTQKRVSKLPLLMLAEKEGINSNEREFYSLSKRKVCARIPVPGPKRCTDVGFGWLLSLGTEGSVCLINPFSKVTIELPEFTYCSESSTCPKFFLITRGVLTANPSETSHFLLYVVATRSLGVWNNKDEKWTKMDSRSSHIVYRSGKIYSFVYVPETDASKRNIGIWDPLATELSKPQAIVQLHDALQSTSGMDMHTDYYLVESTEGELLYITRCCTSIEDLVAGRVGGYFAVKRIDLVKGELTQIYDLGKDAIFVGDNAAVSVDATEFPGILEPNCIYFTDDRYTKSYHGKTYHSRKRPKGGGEDMGIYNVEEGSIERFDVESLSLVSPPLWIFPSF